VLVVAPSIRPWLSKMVRHRIPEMTVLSYTEIPDDQAVKVIFTVEAQNKA
jgi:flagellar biosynthesis protein FlhA